MKNFILCKPNRKTLCVLNGVQLDSVSYTPKLNDLDEIAFTVDRYIIDDDGNKIISQGYDQIHAFMEVYIDGIGYFQIKEPQVSNDGNKETKSVTGVSTDCELLQKDLVGFTVNKTTANSLEMLADNNVNSLGYPNEYITFYNSSNPQLSLMDLVLEKTVGWKVGFIDEPLKNQRFVFDDINENILSFLTKTLSSTAKCIFEFNTVDKTVSAYSENNIGEDTGIIIAYRNLLNNVDMSCNSDNIFTRLNVQGRDSLTFSDINYGDTHVSNLDYYKNTNYMDDKLIAKLDIWEQSRNDNREDYISKVKIYHDYIEQISEIDNKVPTNGVLNNWDNMSMDELTKNQTYYNSLIKSFQITAQNTHPQGSETIYTGNLDDYSPSRLNPDGTVDHEAYMADLDGQGKETYREIITYVLPNIQIAIDNFDKTAAEKSDYLTGYLTEWDLYGIVELKAKQSSYEEQLNTLKNYAKNWSDLTDEEKASHGNNQDNYELYHNEYIKINGYLSEIASKFTELDTQKQSLITSRDVVQSELKQIRTDMAMTGGRIVDGVYTNWFSDDEVEIINLLFHDTDYTNENILTTSLDDFNKQLEIEQELYYDAVAQLDELSIPQYSFSCELDNLLDIEEFKEWKDDFKVGNFITLEVSPNCFTKLRLISISYNPCIKTNDLTVEFSNMVTTKSGRNDFSYIFDKAISVAKNSITYSNNSNKDSIELSTELLNLLSNSSVFQGKFDNLELNTLLSNEIQVVKLTADYAKINELETKYATVDFANITEAAISKIQAIDIDASKITTGTLIADRILLKAPVGSENEGLLYAINNFGDLTSTSVDTIDGYILTERTINADKIIASSITTNELDVNQIFANSAVLTKLTAQDAFIEAISTNSIVVDASSKINNLEIGGANLLLNTKPFAMASSTSLSGALLSGLPMSDGNYYRGFLIRGNTITSSVTEVCRYNFTDFNLGDTFTFSFYVKGNVTELRAFFYGASGYVQVAKCVNSQGEVNTNSDGRCSFAVSDGWERYWVTWTLKTTGNTSVPKYVMIRTNNAVSGQTVYICGCKLEKGNKITDWTPAVEDTETAISDASIANWCYNNNKTYIDGAKIYTGTVTADKITANAITAEKIATDAIKSTNYEANKSGSFLNLADGSFDSKYLKWDESGVLSATNADISGKIAATGGTIGGFTIGTNSLYNGLSTINHIEGQNENIGVNLDIYNGLSVYCDKFGTEIKEGKMLMCSLGREIGYIAPISSDYSNYSKIDMGIIAKNKLGTANLYGQINIGYETMANGGIQSVYTVCCDGRKTENGGFNSTFHVNTRFTSGIDVSDIYFSYGNKNIGSIGVAGYYGVGGTSQSTNTWIPTFTGYMAFKKGIIIDSSVTSFLYHDNTPLLTFASNAFRVGNNTIGLFLIGSQITSSQSITVASDARVKNHIDSLPEGSESLFDYLDGKSFFYNNSVSTQKSYGFIAQDVLSALTSAGLTTDDFAGFCDINGDGSQYALAYEQFIPIMWNEIKRLRKQVKELKGDYNA